MSTENIFELIALIKSANGDPSAVTDAVWEAGYRQPPRTEQEAAQIAIDVFFYCNSFDMPTEFWPRNYDDVLQNELMRAVLVDGEDGPLFDIEPAKVAKSILAAGFNKVVTDDAA
jgi:hypothetical protein